MKSCPRVWWIILKPWTPKKSNQVLEQALWTSSKIVYLKILNRTKLKRECISNRVWAPKKCRRSRDILENLRDLIPSIGYLVLQHASAILFDIACCYLTPIISRTFLVDNDSINPGFKIS